MLHINPPLRFSTDVDIITIENRMDIERILDKIISDSEFNRWELDRKRSYNPGIPKAHYKLSFYSDLENREREILLDILFEETLYPNLLSVDLKLPFIKSNEATIKIAVPSANGLLGDKLTAFAPRTIGIRLNCKKGRDVVKQIFDIGSLYSRVTDINEVAHTFNEIAKKEIEYRELAINEIDIAKDVLDTTFFIAKVFRNIKMDDEYYNPEEIRSALRDFRPFITSKPAYSIESLLLDASIASYLTAMIATRSSEKHRKYNRDRDNLRAYYFIDQEHLFLNRLSRIPNGALYYLKTAFDLL